MNLIEQIMHDMEIGIEPCTVYPENDTVMVMYDLIPIARAIIFNGQYGEQLLTIQQTPSPVPALHIAHERTPTVERYRFIMNFPVHDKKTDDSIKCYLSKKSGVKQSEMESYDIQNIFSEEEMFQFSTLYDIDYNNLLLLNRVQKQLNKLNLKNDYIVSGYIKGLEHFFKE